MARPARILLIDDDDDIREVACTSLELVGGFEVAAVGSGEAGVAAARDHPPDAILLDVMMPGMDGPTTLQRLQDQAETSDVPVILLTAKAQPSDRSRFDQLSVAGVLTKPFDPLTLPQQVSDLLGWER